MTDARPLLLLTRPESAARRFLGQLDAALMRGVDVVISPLIRIAPTVDALDLDAYKALIFTSANGVTAAASATDRRDQVAFCVGPATTHAAQKVGWHAEQTGRTADEMVAALLTRKQEGPMLHLRGQHARGHVAKRLTQAGFPTSQQVIYAQHAKPLSDAAELALTGERPVIVPLFSPRTAKLFAQAAPERPLVIAALSDAVAQEVAHVPLWDIHIAKTPDAQGMGRLVEKLLQTPMSG